MELPTTGNENMPGLIQQVCDQVDHYIEIDRKKYQSGLDFHRDRLIFTILRIRNIVEMIGAKKVFVLGDFSPIEFIIGSLKLCPGTDFVSSGQADLRYPMPQLNSNQFDLIVGTEVLEHIKDQNEGARDKFNFSGLRCLLRECNRILKTDGVLFLTTPNSSSRKSLIRTLLGRSPFCYYPHVREYSPEQIFGILTSFNFSVDILETIDFYISYGYPITFDFNYISKGNSGEEFNFDWVSQEDTLRIIDEIDAKYGFDNQLRGDTIIAHVKKISDLS